MNLSPKELEVFERLKTVNGNSIWSIAIKNVADKPEPWKIKMLICNLKEQAFDDSDIMKNILGHDILKAVVEL